MDYYYFLDQAWAFVLLVVAVLLWGFIYAIYALPYVFLLLLVIYIINRTIVFLKWICR